MHGLLVGWYGASNRKLTQYGIQPRQPSPGRRRRAKAPAVVTQPAPVS